MGAGPYNEPLASPGNFFPGRKRRVAELFAELLGRSFLPFPHFAAVDHYIMRVALSPRPRSRQISRVVLSYLNVPLASSSKARDRDSKTSRSAHTFDPLP